MSVWIVIAVLLTGAVSLGVWLRRYPAAAPVCTAMPDSALPAAAEAAPSEEVPMSITSVASSLLAKLQAVAALLPILTSLVKTVEASLPAGTPGAAKLKAVEDAMASVYAKEQVASASFSEVWPLLAGVASSLVATFKATGEFTSSKPAAPEPVADSEQLATR